MKIRTLIVDDERHARQKIRALLSAEADVEIVRECANGDEAIRAIRETAPDLVFLDVQMPGRNGFDVIAEAGSDARHVVFVTAFDQYAVRAFEVQALDYLLKPFDRERFGRAMQRARAQLQDGEGLQERLLALAKVMGEQQPKPAVLDRLMIRAGGRIT
ncbi:MAG TPA: response regulator, partial [Thermoanaerobaculia bacterium]|nr:response regulator [Thermoanaerobaculia bacterium]